MDDLTPATTEDAPDDSLRAGLEAAYDEHAADESALPADTPASPSAAGTSAAPPAGEPATGTVPAVVPDRAIPERLKARFGESWSTLPSGIRDVFHEYETNIGRLSSKYGTAAKNWERTEQAFAPYREMVAKEGGDFHGAVSNLFETARILRQGAPEQKLAVLRQTAIAFGIPLESIVQSPGADPAQTGASEALINRLNQLEREVLTNRATQTHTAQQQTSTEIEAFVADPANVYLQEPGYMETMAVLIREGRASDLASAYKEAAWLHERTRQLEIARQSQQRASEQQATATRARRAAASVNGTPTGPVRVDPSKLTLRDTLSAAFDGELT